MHENLLNALVIMKNWINRIFNQYFVCQLKHVIVYYDIFCGPVSVRVFTCKYLLSDVFNIQLYLLGLRPSSRHSPSEANFTKIRPQFLGSTTRVH